MNIGLIYRQVALLASLSLLLGCAVNPVSGKNELSLISPQQEIALGKKNYQPSRQSQGGDYYIDDQLQAYVAGVGKKIAAVSDRPDLPYEFKVLNNSVPNAWALPGGKIAINRGLLSYLDDESQLAAVLAHEIVHAAARHGAAQMSRGTLANLGLAAVAVGTQGRDGAQLYGLASQLGTAAWMAKYGRDDELESDYYGMEYMALAGYEPQGAVELQRTFVQLSEGQQTDFLSGLFASHPPSHQRVDANSVKAATLPKGERYRQRYQTAIAQLKKDAPAYEAEEKAIAALNKKQGQVALEELDKSVALQPREASFWEMRGHAWNLIDRPDNAEKSFTTAIGKNPEHFSGYLARGVLRYEQGKQTSGLRDIKRSYQLLPTAEASYYLGESALQAKQYQIAANYFEQASQAGGELAKRSKAQLLSMKLELEPESFMRTAAVVSGPNNLRVRLRNNSPAAMIQVQLQVDKMANAYQIASSKIVQLPYKIEAGREIEFDIKIASIAEAPSFRVTVVEAKSVK